MNSCSASYIDIDGYVWKSYVYIRISQLCQLRRLRSNNTPIAMSTPSTQILVSNTPLQEKELGHLGKMADSKAGAGYIQNGPKASYSVRK